MTEYPACGMVCWNVWLEVFSKVFERALIQIADGPMIDAKDPKPDLRPPPVRRFSVKLFAWLLGACAVLAQMTTHAVSTGSAGGSADRSFEYFAPQVYAVGDVHGAYEALIELLQANRLIDKNNHWTGGKAHLVSLGDLLDRGPRSRDVMDLFRRLQSEAVAAGGRVHVLMGNHEVMNLTGDLRDVSEAEFAAFAETAGESAVSDEPQVTGVERLPRGYAEHRGAFAPDGEYGRWLMGLPLMIKVNDTVFAHGGLSPLLAAQSLADVNAAASRELLGAVRLQSAETAPATLLGDHGPLWYRGNAGCHPLLETAVVKKQLAVLSAQRLVIGHTPTPTRQVRQRLDGQVYVIDTGMLKSVYRGAPYLLALGSSGDETTGISKVVVLDASAQRSEPQWWHPLLTEQPAVEETLAQALRDGVELSGRWVSAGKKQMQRALARWRLDRELGLWMTPMIIADAAGKRYFEVSRTSAEAWITERQRREQGRHFPNYCAAGHQNFLITAFDALTGVTTRSVDTLLVHRGTGTAQLATIKQAFGTSAVLPQYSTPPTLPSVMAGRLRNLSAERLQELLGHLLTKRQIKALLVRRDKILQWPLTLPTIQPMVMSTVSVPPAQKEQTP